MDSLSDLDRQRLEQLNSLLREDLATLYDTERQLAAATRPLEMRQLRQDAEQVRANYDHLRKEYTGLLRKEISTRFAPGEQALIQTIGQRLSADQLVVTRTALQEVDRNQVFCPTSRKGLFQGYTVGMSSGMTETR